MECDKVKAQYPEVIYEPCCESCHEDSNIGHGDDLWFEIGGESRNVCCAVERSFKRWRKRIDNGRPV